MALLFVMGGMAQNDAQMVVSTESGLVKGFDHEGSMGFLGIPYDVADTFWKATLKYYFGTDDPAKLQEIENKAAIIGYTRVLRRTMRKATESEDYKARMIDFCKKTLCELVPQTDNLYF